MITLTKLKRAGGDETPRFEATLCWNSKPVAVVSNGGTGGRCRVWWAPPGNKPPDRDTVLAVLREASRQAKRLHPDLFRHIDPEADPFARYDGEAALDTVLMHEVELAGLAKALDRACKTKIVLRTPGQRAGAYLVISVPPTAHEIADVRRRYPCCVVLNEMPLRERAERVMSGEPT
jgi:hypothetical protein